MGKFKVGDRVKACASFVGSAKPGDTGTVGQRALYWCDICDEELVDIMWDRTTGGHMQNDGGYYAKDFELVNDNSPVRTVTRREIVPGKYGTVGVQTVFNGKIGIFVPAYQHSPEELRSAARIFNEIADVLDEQKEAA